MISTNSIARNATAAGTIRFSAAGNAADGNGSNSGDFIYTATATSNGPAGVAPITGVFSQVAVGGGYTTIVTLTNTGSDALSGDLILTRSDGTPMDVKIAAPSALSEQPGSDRGVFASSSPLSIPPGGISILSLAAPGQAQPVTGWARVESSEDSWAESPPSSNASATR